MSTLSKREIKTSIALSSVVGLRIFGLFLMMPVLTPYALQLPAATPFLVGLAVGVYGFAQAFLQVPAGMLSDRLGRHLTITIGLLVFMLGSFVAAVSHDIGGIIVGRVLQGMGVVSGSIQALAADHSHEENRSKVMAIIGIGVGVSLIMAIVLGAPLATMIGLHGLFGLTAFLALLGIVLLWAWVPRIHTSRVSTAVGGMDVLRMLVKPQLLVLNISVFMAHAVLTAAFVALPLMLAGKAGMTLDKQWHLYLPVMLIALLVMGCVLHRVTSLRGSVYLVMCCALGLGLGLLGFSVVVPQRIWILWFAAIFFFSAFNVLEASLPSLVSRLAPVHLRGAVLGAYATSQFLGAGVGGLVGGSVLEYLGQSAVFVAAAALLVLWLPLLWASRTKLMVEAS